MASTSTLDTVVKAKHPSLVGLKGIIVQETEGTFRIVTAKNRVKGEAELLTGQQSQRNPSDLWSCPVQSYPSGTSTLACRCR